MLLKTRVVVCSLGSNRSRKRAVIDATLQAGAKEAYMIEEPMAAAIVQIFLWRNLQGAWLST